GHSLLVAQVLTRIQQAFKVELPLRAIFEEATIRGLGRFIQTGQHSATESSSALQREPARTKAPLSLAQEGLWFLNQLDPECVAYNIAAGVRVQGEIDVTALQSALSIVEERHESLRTTFAIEQGRPVQIVGPTGGLRLALVDLSGQTAA